METKAEGQPALKLIGLLAHQMSQPLTVLLGEVELALRFQHSEAELKGTFERCFRDLERMARLVSDFRTVGAMSEATISRVPVAEMMDGVIAAHLSEAELKGLSLDYKASPGASVETDPEVLQRVFSTVLGSAVRMSPPGGSVQVRLDKCRGEVQFRLSYMEATSNGSKQRFGPALQDTFRVPLADDVEWALVEGMIQLLGGVLKVYRSAGPRIHLSLTLGQEPVSNLKVSKASTALAS
ncbi:MAG TPA: HAMP domain-containing sensor histidine kinase [Terriglobia bacterium]|nr:HAMP domain-containing sensor histidine kinase [Terriglobia bacterium]